MRYHASQTLAIAPSSNHVKETANNSLIKNALTIEAIYHSTISRDKPYLTYNILQEGIKLITSVPYQRVVVEEPYGEILAQVHHRISAQPIRIKPYHIYIIIQART